MIEVELETVIEVELGENENLEIPNSYEKVSAKVKTSVSIFLLQL